MQIIALILLVLIAVWIIRAMKNKNNEGGDFERKLHEVGRGRVNEKITIEYSSLSSEATTREIVIKRVLASHDGEIYLKAYCSLRKAPRLFKVERIESFIDSDGVVIPKRSFLSERLGINLWAKALRAKAVKLRR